MKEQFTYDKYKRYNAEELLEDTFFIKSFIDSEKEAIIFWDSLVKKGFLDKNALETALFYLRSVQMNSELPQDSEVSDMWKNILYNNQLNQNNKQKTIGRKCLILISSIAAGIMLVSMLFINPIKEESTLENSFVLSIEDVKAPDLLPNDIQLMVSEERYMTFEEESVNLFYQGNTILKNDHDSIQLGDQINENYEFNQLLIPYGKRSMLTLADGTIVWLNAGSRLVYPKQFRKDLREVYIDGEAFFDVARDENCPFIVKAKNFSLEVLGTTFNVMSYESDSIHHVVLVSGSVEVQTKDNRKRQLKPSDMFLVNDEDFKISKVNTNDYVLWKEGIVQYRSENLSVILTRLSRYYGTEIVWMNEIASIPCSGRLKLNEGLENILEGISHSAPIKYRIENGKIMIENLKRKEPM